MKGNNKPEMPKPIDFNDLNSFSWNSFLIKVLIFCAIIISVVLYTDSKGYFNADQKNNHIRKKWSSFYDYTQQKQVDVVILGNSHVLTGIDPFVLSDATSSVCFMLGNSGTNIMDAWFQLGGVLKQTKPKLVVLETYCINNTNSPKDEEIIPYLQSFDAQSDFTHKIQCMPHLFQSDYWIGAWSTTIRNHSFLLTDTARIKFNIKNQDEIQSKKLNLGRFARFGFGLQDSTLAKYAKLGAPVKGNEYRISEFSKKYLRKIMDLCQKENIPVLFLTVPMYHKHVSNYAAWKQTLSQELKKYTKAKWLDLQAHYDSVLYTPEMFENTYAENQHLSNAGMTASAYKLAQYIFGNYPKLLPDRSQDKKWIDDFSTTDHFIYNQPVPVGMPGFLSIIKNKQIDKFCIKELAIIQIQKTNRLILKVNKKPNLPEKITVECKFTSMGKEMIAPLNMVKPKELFSPNYVVYIADLKPNIKIIDVLKIK